MCWFRRVWSWRLLLAAPDPQASVQALLGHVHRWGACKWNGQYWYARCIASESCTARYPC